MTQLRTESPQAKSVSALPDQRRTDWNLVLWNLDLSQGYFTPTALLTLHVLDCSTA